VDCRDAVAAHKWHDADTLIHRDVAGWRACFPRATAANISGARYGPNKWVRDADFAHLAGLRELHMARCVDVTDAAFAHLRGIHTLDMSECTQRTITDAAFAHLAGIHALRMRDCPQPTITDAAFAHLAGIHTLNIDGCYQHTISDAAFAHLAGIHTLLMEGCDQDTITDAAFAHLAGIRCLDMSFCSQATITDGAIDHVSLPTCAISPPSRRSDSARRSFNTSPGHTKYQSRTDEAATTTSPTAASPAVTARGRSPAPPLRCAARSHLC
jgi:hypothetical protein